MTALIDHVAGETGKTKGERKSMQEKGVWEIKAGEFTSTVA